jgi:hypothetical protein
LYLRPYIINMDAELEKEWQLIVKQLGSRFGEEIDFKGILFLIGVQELGKGFAKYNKQQKTELMHVAVCSLLEGYGYYTFVGKDEEGWPHWTLNESLPSLKPMEQERLIKQAIVLYFQKNTTFDT